MPHAAIPDGTERQRFRIALHGIEGPAREGRDEFARRCRDRRGIDPERDQPLVELKLGPDRVKNGRPLGVEHAAIHVDQPPAAVVFKGG